MSELNAFGIRERVGQRLPGDAHRRIVRVSPLSRVLAFTGRSIDDVVNDPVVKREVLGYFKLQKWVQRGCEQVDLQRQWNVQPNDRVLINRRPPL